MKQRYILTFWQRVELYLFLRPIWTFSDKSKRKSWHDVKKGMEKHEHRFTIPKNISGYRFMGCEHEGCNMVEPVEKFK